MRIKLVGCASTMNEIRALGVPENTECEFLDFNFHANPALLNKKLQEIINDSQYFDLIILTNSRCSNALTGLVSPRVPLVFPRTHDCIGLLLGSNERHMKMFKENAAVYYFSQGWLDYGRNPYAEFLEYQEKYGRETAKSLIDTLYGHYKKALLIKTPGIKNIDQYRQKVKEIADFFGWETAETEGDARLLTSLIHAEDGQDIVSLPPGTAITEDLLQGME